MSSSNKPLSNPEAREALIQRLLKEREDALRKKQQYEEWYNTQQALSSPTNQVATAPTSQVAPASTSHETSHDPHETPNHPPASRKNRTARSPARKPATHRQDSASTPKPRSGGQPRVTKTSAATRTPKRVDNHRFSRKSVEEVRQQIAAERSKEYTFKPNIKKTQSRKTSASMSREERLKQLAEPRNKFWEERARDRALKNVSETTECTFQPNVGPGSARKPHAPKQAWQHRANRTFAEKVPIEERLFMEANERQQAREKAEREWKDAQVKQHDFRPKVNRVSKEIVKVSDYRPLQERIDDIQQAKQERLARARIDAVRENKDLTFQPVVSKTSQRIAELSLYKEGRQGGEDVVDRLTREAQMLESKKKKHAEDRMDEERKAYQFKPQLSKTTKRLVANNPAFEKTFVERQEELIERQREKKLQRAMGHVESNGKACTFKPSIGNAEDILIHTRPQRLTETEDERYERLAKKERERTDKLKEFISLQYYSQFDFKPKINEISKALGTSTGGAEGLYNNAMTRKLKQDKKVQELQAMDECTFQPQINHTSSAIDIQGVEKTYDFLDPDAMLERIEDNRRNKENKLNQMRREREYEELKTCTFNPQVVKNRPVPKNEPVVVRGLGRYLELKELAKRREDEQREREEKVFHKRPQGNKNAYTIPQPFNLSSGRSSKSRRQRDQATEVQEHHTFKPKTQHAKRQASLSRILRE